MTQQSLSNRQARRIALRAQGFLPQLRSLKRADRRHLDRIFEQVSLLQIDSVNVLDRAHYLTLFARLGAYDRGLIDKAVHHIFRNPLEERKKGYFEYWGHEASILPVELYPALRWRMERASQGGGIWRGIARFAQEKPETIEMVYQEIARHGPCPVGQLEKRGSRSGPWWGWNDTKIALEYLFWCGRITSAGRNTFTRYYDLPERVLPQTILQRPAMNEAEAHRHLMALAAKSHGVGSEKCLRDYFRLGSGEARTALRELVEEGIVETTEIEGWSTPTYRHRDASLPARATCQALLAPFDSLVWERGRAEALFNFRYRIEIYVPKEKRQFGYYVLPFLLGDQLVARLDLKANRQEGILEVFASHGEDQIDRDKVSASLADELCMMAPWHGLEDIRIHPNGNLSEALHQAMAKQ